MTHEPILQFNVVNERRQRFYDISHNSLPFLSLLLLHFSSSLPVDSLPKYLLSLPQPLLLPLPQPLLLPLLFSLLPCHIGVSFLSSGPSLFASLPSLDPSLPPLPSLDPRPFPSPIVPFHLPDLPRLKEKGKKTKGRK